MDNFIEELRWRGMIQDVMPETEEHVMGAMRTAYVGFDPTAESLHIGNLVPIMLLSFFQRCGHKPIALVGGATGMIGDPSMKISERNLLDEETLQRHVKGIEKQLSRFLDFSGTTENSAMLVNNYDWMKEFSFLEFIRNIGKHITVNYMMAKDSVKSRLGGESNSGLSFTEFSYQLIQGYDFLHLYRNHRCTLQMGGSDQWGNITTGAELIRRVDNGKGYALTCPLVTKSDGSKFGKSEGGNIWLDADKTSPYRFYQYWLNSSDEDAKKYIKTFTFLDKETIEALIEEHNKTPHLRLLQKQLGQEVTTTVHGYEAFEKAVKASELLFGKSTSEDLKSLDEITFLDVFEGVPQAEILRSDIKEGVDVIDALAGKTNFLKSNSEARRALKENSIAVNREKVSESYSISENDLINNRFILLQRGRKNYFVIRVV